MKRSCYFLFLFLVSIYACHKDNPCPNVPLADFTISESCAGCGFPWVDYISDTVYGEWITFNAVNKDAQYEWIIGAGTYTTQSVELNFATASNNATIPITCIVHNVPDNSCYKNDIADTIIKNMTINRNTPLFFGQWLGSYVDTVTNQPISDTLSAVTIKNVYSNFNPEFDSVPAIYGLKPYSDTIADPDNGLVQSYKELTFLFDWGVFPNIQGRALVDSTNNIEIDVYWYDKNHNQISERFKGKRL